MFRTSTDVTQLFKAAFRRYPTGVAVITATGPGGPVGLTASSVASVSVEPPALSFSVMGTRSARAIVEAPSFVVNMLGPGHATLAHDFAHAGRPRFTPEQGWDVLPTGEPVLAGALATLRGTRCTSSRSAIRQWSSRRCSRSFSAPAAARLVYHDREFIAHPS